MRLFINSLSVFFFFLNSRNFIDNISNIIFNLICLFYLFQPTSSIYELVNMNLAQAYLNCEPIIISILTHFLKF